MLLFIKRTFILCLPIVLVVAGLEFYIKTSKSTYLLKSQYFKHQEYETIILGSSHCQNAINPAYLNSKTCNAAMGSQDLKMDLALLKKSIALNHHLKYVVLEMSYHRFRENPKKYWRDGMYEYFYELDLSEGINFSKFLLISSNLKFFRNYFGEILSRRKHSYQYNEFGFDENDFDGIFKVMNYDEERIAETSRNRLRIDNWMSPDETSINNSINYLKEINQICIKNDIQLVLVAPPVYKTYSNEFRELNLSNRSHAIDILRSDNAKIIYLNFEESNLFKVNHFKNDDHLNAKGAELFTTMLNEYILAKK